MKEEYRRVLQQAAENVNELKRTFVKLKKKRPKNLDDFFHAAHDEAFSRIDCLECANCCKTTSPIFRDVDIKRISRRLKTTEAAFTETYLRLDEDNDWVLKESPCAFLLADNTCSIYEFRPQACREYPHTDRKRMVQILDLTIRNTTICPGVAEVCLEVKKEFD